MKSEFSESTYAFLLCNEIINKQRRQRTISSIPIFPSLLEEATVGYDVKIPRKGLPLFLQFKLAQYLKPNSRALCSSNYNQNFFRITLYRRAKSEQHNLLCKLAHKHLHVYYTAPSFYLQKDFNRFFINESIEINSVFISLKSLNRITDDEEHYISYINTKPTGFMWHSEEGTYVEYPISGRDWSARIEEGLRDPENFDQEYLVNLRATLVEIVGRERLRYELSESPYPLIQNNDTPSVLRDINYLLNAYFGCTVIFLNSDNSE